MDGVEINDLFFKDRFPSSGWKLLTLCLYSPCGLALAILRLFILIQAYLAATLLPEMSLIRRFVLRMISIILGVVVQEENRSQFEKKSKVIISNHITFFDHIPLHVVTGCIAPSFSRPHLPLTWGLKDLGIKQGKEVFKENVRSLLSKAESPLLIHPEEETTSGIVGLLKFSSWYGFASSSIQPVSLRVWRPPITDITPNYLRSSAISDLFWFLFVPFTIFKIKYLPVITRNSGETDEELISRVETTIANELGIRNTNFNALDKAEFQKRYIAELNRPVVITEGPSPPAYGYTLLRVRLERMSAQVKEVLPHVPKDVILKDLRKTRNVDLTIANILEGVVYYVPLPDTEVPLAAEPTHPEDSDTTPSPPSTPSTPSTSSCSSTDQMSPMTSQEAGSSFPKSAQERMLSLVERKKHMIEVARQRYIERHGLGSL